MESVIIEEMRAFLRLDLNPRQHKYFTDTINVAKRVKVVPVSEVFNEREIELIRRIVRPEKQACYKNAHLLTFGVGKRYPRQSQRDDRGRFAVTESDIW